MNTKKYGHLPTGEPVSPGEGFELVKEGEIACESNIEVTFNGVDWSKFDNQPIGMETIKNLVERWNVVGASILAIRRRKKAVEAASNIPLSQQPWKPSELIRRYVAEWLVEAFQKEVTEELERENEKLRCCIERINSDLRKSIDAAMSTSKPESKL